MPIVGLTGRGASFPEIGQLRKGAEKPKEGNKPGKDLDHFRFDSADPGAVAAFKAAFGDTPSEVEVLVPYPTTDENFDAWREEWAASSLKHRCDGVTCVRWLTPKGTYSDEPKPCPGGCKQSGRLKVIVPALQRFAYVTVMTTSIWDILTIHQNLTALEMMRGSLQGIPLILRRVEREISTPRDGKRVRTKKWLITIEAKPSWVRLQLAAQQQAALPVFNEPLMLAPGQIDDEDVIDIQREPTVDPERAEVLGAMKALYESSGAADWQTYEIKELDRLSTEKLKSRLAKWQEAALKKAQAADPLASQRDEADELIGKLEAAGLDADSIMKLMKGIIIAEETDEKKMTALIVRLKSALNEMAETEVQKAVGF